MDFCPDDGDAPHRSSITPIESLNTDDDDDDGDDEDDVLHKSSKVKPYKPRVGLACH